jgi:hypothetical protein
MHDHHTRGHTHKPGELKEKLLLGYMLEHNKQHIKELIELATKLQNSNKHDTAAIILNAVYDYETGNDKLMTALKTL